jgi:cation/acetate symporter
MIKGLTFKFCYIAYLKIVRPETNNAMHWWFGISPEGIVTLGILMNFAVSAVVMRLTPPPPPEIQQLVANIRVPGRASNLN